jgi:K+-sensing histidine kinase KdpD
LSRPHPRSNEFFFRPVEKTEIYMSRAVPTNYSKIFIDYAVAVAAVTIAFGLTFFLWIFIEPEAAPLFLAAVAITAWRGGIYPSLLAAAL